jgi:hypothetical protein
METLILTFPCKPGADKDLLEAFKTALTDTSADTGMSEQLGPLLAGSLKEEWLVSHNI